MCCRVVIDITKETKELILRDLMIDDPNQIDLFTSYNMSPGQFLPIIHKEAAIVMDNMMWGYVPIWGDKKKILPNARVESVANKPTFKESFRKRRCLLPVKGYYEWAGKKGDRTPYYFYHQEGDVLGLGCIYEFTKNDKGEDLTRFTVITREAIEPFKSIHHRMPLIIKPNFWQKWIDCSKPLAIKPVEMNIDYIKSLRFHEVSKMVNNVSNDTEELIQEDRKEKLF